MRNLSNGALLGIGCLLCFCSALGGGLLALALDQPDVVVTQQVVEVPATAPSKAPSAGDLERLTARFIDAGGTDPDTAPALVSELGGAVCDDGYSAEQIAEVFARDLTMSDDALAAFVAEVQAACAVG